MSQPLGFPLMLRSGPVIRASPESQSICKVDAIKKEETQRDARGKGEEKRNCDIQRRVHTHSLCFSFPSWLSLLPLCCVWLNTLANIIPRSFLLSLFSHSATLMSSSSFTSSLFLSFSMLRVPLKCQHGTSGWQAAPFERAPSKVLLQCEDRLKGDEEAGE